jgi:hypothetical protein
VAQVVVDKAEQAGWAILQERLLDVARCNFPDKNHPQGQPLFPATCKVLRTSDIHDIISQPDTLLQAAAQDLLAYVTSEMKKSAKLAPYADAFGHFLLTTSSGKNDPDALASLLLELRTGGTKSVSERLTRDLLARIEAQYTTPIAGAAPGVLKCPGPTTVASSLYIVGLCAIQAQSLDNMGTCDFEPILRSCSATDPDRVRALVGLAFTAFASTTKGVARADAVIDMDFALAEAAVYDGAFGTYTDEQRTYAVAVLHSEQDVIRGIVDADWVRATSGGIDIAERIVSAAGDNDDAKDEFSARKRILALLAAAGKYAATIKNPTNADKVQAEREQIIKELVSRMVNRTNRTTGMVVSLGGNLGLIGGVRTISGDVQPAFPAQLGLGVGLQSYHNCTCGFHAMLTGLDLGQYLTLDAGDLKVQTPDAAASVIIGATAGIWFLSRTTPFYVGPYLAGSPFVKSTTGKATIEVGLATGIYVPLLDFN